MAVTERNTERMAPIRCRLDQLMQQRGVSASELQKATGLSFTTIRKLRLAPLVAVDLQVLDRLCQALQCDVGDLLERFPED